MNRPLSYVSRLAHLSSLCLLGSALSALLYAPQRAHCLEPPEIKPPPPLLTLSRERSSSVTLSCGLRKAFV